MVRASFSLYDDIHTLGNSISTSSACMALIFHLPGIIPTPLTLLGGPTNVEEEKRLKAVLRVLQGTAQIQVILLTKLLQDLRVGNKYRIGRKIGSGSFGDIYLGTLSQT